MDPVSVTGNTGTIGFGIELTGRVTTLEFIEIMVEDGEFFGKVQEVVVGFETSIGVEEVEIGVETNGVGMLEIDGVVGELEIIDTGVLALVVGKGWYWEDDTDDNDIAESWPFKEFIEVVGVVIVVVVLMEEDEDKEEEEVVEDFLVLAKRVSFFVSKA